MNTPVPFTVCIPAGGTGTRMGAALPKQYLEIAGKPILIHTLEVFDRMPQCQRIILAVPDPEEAKTFLDAYGSTKTSVIQGGETRQESVFNCLSVCEEDNSIVLVHDAVRPCVTAEQVQHVIDAITLHGAAMLAMPARDTIKWVEHGHVQETLNRERIWLAQTPQGAPLKILKRAFGDAISAGFTGTDDASLLERIGLKVAVVEGSPENIKVTTPEDIAIAEIILKKRQEAA